MRSSFVAPCAAFSVCQPAAPRKVLLSSTNTMPPPRRANIAARYSDVGVLPEPPLPLATALPLGRVHTFETAILSASSACCAWLGPPMPNWARTPANPPTGAGVGVSVRCFPMNVWSKGWCASGARGSGGANRGVAWIRRTPSRPAAGLAGADFGVGRPRRAQGRHDVTTVLPASGRRRVIIRRFWCSWRTRALGRVETLHSAGGWLCSGRLGGRFDPARVGRFARVRGPCVGRGRFDAACAHFTVRDDEGNTP